MMYTTYLLAGGGEEEGSAEMPKLSLLLWTPKLYRKHGIPDALEIPAPVINRTCPPVRSVLAISSESLAKELSFPLGRFRILGIE